MGEEKLWKACLLEALLHASLYGCGKGTPTQACLRRYDHLWVFSDEMRVGSFLWICETLDLCPIKIRKRLQEAIERQQKLDAEKSLKSVRAARLFTGGSSRQASMPGTSTSTVSISSSVIPSLAGLYHRQMGQIEARGAQRRTFVQMVPATRERR